MFGREVTAMLISTKGRYALRVMIDLAENYGNGFVPMKEVAKRQNISLKYLERIFRRTSGKRRRLPADLCSG